MTYEQAELLITDRRFQQLKYLQEKTNVFAVVGQTHTEHWHSSFMSWLLDPNSSLCLGRYPLEHFLMLYLIKSEDSDFSMQDIFDMDLDKMHFETEKTLHIDGKGKRAIDVYGQCDKLAIVIENKVKALENYNGTDVGQTKDYYEYMEKNKKEGQKILYIFITPNPRQKPFRDSYIQITYQEFFDYVIAKCLIPPQLNTDGKYFLEQYANNLREPVHNAPMALVNIDICCGLYEDYADFLDEIFDNVESTSELSGDTGVGCTVYRRFQSVFDEIYLSIDVKRYGRTPKSLLQSSAVTFTDMYNKGIVMDGMKFEMEYKNVKFYAVAEYDKAEEQCYLLVLDENKQPYHDGNGKKIGYYRTSSQAGMDAINLYRKKHGIGKGVASLRGTTYWKTEDGRAVKDLIESM